MGGKVRRGKRGFSAMANDICMRKCATIRLWCSFALPEQFKSALVLVLVSVLLLFLLLLLVAVVVAAVVVAAVSTSDSCIFVAPKNHQMGGLFVFFLHIRSKKNTVNTNVFGTPEAQNHGIYGMFVTSDSKNHAICNVFWARV